MSLNQRLEEMGRKKQELDQNIAYVDKERKGIATRQAELEKNERARTRQVRGALWLVSRGG